MSLCVVTEMNNVFISTEDIVRYCANIYTAKYLEEIKVQINVHIKQYQPKLHIMKSITERIQKLCHNSSEKYLYSQYVSLNVFMFMNYKKFTVDQLCQTIVDVAGQIYYRHFVHVRFNHDLYFRFVYLAHFYITTQTSYKGSHDRYSDKLMRCVAKISPIYTNQYHNIHTTNVSLASKPNRFYESG